ncbi:MAG: helix-turn-helix domain-containing protein [Candidatus Colwellbacteria bacterium]|nr:helix-turn-helix domain-containing protein [Candidatus Colwellbacteria bacterium]
MTSDRNLGETITELTGSRGVSAEKLSELTNIPKRYITALFENDIKNMPAAPYVRGYLNKIASVIGIDPEPLQESYRRLNLKTSGREDYLPKNRFAIAKSKKGWIAAVIILLIVGYFVSVRLNALLGIPSISINLPEKVADNSFIETRDPIFIAEGDILPKDSLFINNEAIPVDGNGHFSKEMALDGGLNTFEIRVKRFLGREKTIIRKVFYIVDETGENTIQEPISEKQAESKTGETSEPVVVE